MPQKERRATGPKGLTEDKIVSALLDSAGIIAHAAAKLGIDRSGLHRRIGRSLRLTQAYEGMREVILDEAEAVIIEAITKKKDAATARWYLSMKGAGRGYRSNASSYLTDRELQTVVGAVAANGIDALIALKAAIVAPSLRVTNSSSLHLT